MTTPEIWADLYDRLKKAEIELEELADATDDINDASRLMSKMHGVSLARDYMRGYFDPTSVAAATGVAESLTASLRPDTSQPEPNLTIWKFVINPFTKTKMPHGAKLLYVGEQDTDVCVWALVDPSIAATEHRAIDAYGTGHTIPANPGRFIGSVQMANGENAGLVFHIFDGDAAGV